MLTKKIKIGDLCVYSHNGYYKNVSLKEVLDNKHNEVMLTINKSELSFFRNQKFINFTCLSTSGRVINIPQKFLVKVMQYKIE